MKTTATILLFFICFFGLGQEVQQVIINGSGQKVYINLPGNAGTILINYDAPPPPPEDNEADAPIVERLTTASTGNKINIYLSKAMLNPSAYASQFAVAGKTVTAAALRGSDNTVVELTLNSAFAEGQEVLLSYTKGSVIAVDSGFLQSFSSAPVLNTVTTSTVPFFENWDMLIDGTDASTMELSGSNVTLLRDKAATGRIFFPQSTAYATYDGVLNVVQGATNEYTTEDEFRIPADNTFTVFLKFKTPALGATGSTNPMYFFQHNTAGGAQLSQWNAGISRRNMRIMTTSDYFHSAVVQSTITHNDDYHYVVATYNGTTYKLWDNGNYTSRSVTVSSVKIFNRVFQLTTSRAGYSLVAMGVGPYLSDSDVSTLHTFLNTYGE